MNYDKLKNELRRFSKERDWEQFHNIKDLAAALAIESSELLEHFLWAKEEDLGKILEKKREKIEEEAADILSYLILFSEKANIDLEKALLDKINKNDKKYPASKVKGSSKKYSEY